MNRRKFFSLILGGFAAAFAPKALAAKPPAPAIKYRRFPEWVRVWEMGSVTVMCEGNRIGFRTYGRLDVAKGVNPDAARPFILLPRGKLRSLEVRVDWVKNSLMWTALGVM